MAGVAGIREEFEGAHKFERAENMRHRETIPRSRYSAPGNPWWEIMGSYTSDPARAIDRRQQEYGSVNRTRAAGVKIIPINTEEGKQ